MRWIGIKDGKIAGLGEDDDIPKDSKKTIDINNIHVVSKIDSKELILKDSDFINSIKTSIIKLEVYRLLGLLMHNSDLMNKWNDEFSEKIKILKEKILIYLT